MATEIDEVLEAATADCFWVPPDVEIVERPAIKYTHSERASENFNRVVRVRPDLADPEALVAEVTEAHAGSRSRWALTPMSDRPALRRAPGD